MAKPWKELKHPIRAALIAWAAMSLLFVVFWPFVPFGVSYLLLGIGYSAFLAWVAIGVCLFLQKGSNLFAWRWFAAVWLSSVALLPIGLFVTLEFRWLSLVTLGVVLWIGQIVLYLSLLAMTLISLWGWVRFFRKGHPSDTPTCGA